MPQSLLAHNFHHSPLVWHQYQQYVLWLTKQFSKFNFSSNLLFEHSTWLEWSSLSTMIAMTDQVKVFWICLTASRRHHVGRPHMKSRRSEYPDLFPENIQHNSSESIKWSRWGTGGFLLVHLFNCGGSRGIQDRGQGWMGYEWMVAW